MGYLQVILLGLQIIQSLLKWANDKKQFDAGQQKQILEQTKAVLGMTAEGKRILEKINAMSDSDLDDVIGSVGNANKGG